MSYVPYSTESERDKLVRYFVRLFGDNPVAIVADGENPIAPTMPTTGVLVVESWHANTQNVEWYNPPEGWSQLVAAEERAAREGDRTWPFVVVHDERGTATGRLERWCVRLDHKGYKPLYARPWTTELELLDFVTVILDLCGLEDPDDPDWRCP